MLTIRASSGIPAAVLVTPGCRGGGRVPAAVDLDALARPAARTIAGLRIFFGLSALVAPRLAPRLWVGPSTREPAGIVLGRAAGVRDLALGAGVLVADGPGERLWVAAGAVCDVVDGATTLRHWRLLPTRGRVLTVGGALGAAVVGAVAAARMRPGAC